MTPAQFDAACRALPAVTSVVQWGADNVYKVGGRVFAVIGSAGGCSFKVSEIAFEALTSTGRGRQAPYFARGMWVAIDDITGVDKAEMTDWLKTSHRLVAAKLTGVRRRELGLS